MKITFCAYRWMNPVIILGNRRELQIDDLYKLSPADESETLGFALLRYDAKLVAIDLISNADNFSIFREWRKETTASLSQGGGNTRKPSLTKALIRTFGFKILALGLGLFAPECIFR